MYSYVSIEDLTVVIMLPLEQDRVKNVPGNEVSGIEWCGYLCCRGHGYNDSWKISSSSALNQQELFIKVVSINWSLGLHTCHCWSKGKKAINSWLFFIEQIDVSLCIFVCDYIYFILMWSENLHSDCSRNNVICFIGVSIFSTDIKDHRYVLLRN